MVILKNQSLPELNPNPCQEVQDEAETLRQELSSLVAEIREYAKGLKATYEPDSQPDQIADGLLALVRGDR